MPDCVVRLLAPRRALNSKQREERPASYKLQTFIHYRTLLPRHHSLPKKGKKCNLCVRYDLLPMSRVAHHCRNAVAFACLQNLVFPDDVLRLHHSDFPHAFIGTNPEALFPDCPTRAEPPCTFPLTRICANTGAGPAENETTGNCVTRELCRSSPPKCLWI